MTSSFAQAGNSDCHTRALNYFNEQGPVSTDFQKEVGADSYILPAHKPLYNIHGDFLAIYNEDMEVFRGVGSEHSGWFENAIIVNPVSCHLVSILEIAAE